jgi:hypothetical protein
MSHHRVWHATASIVAVPTSCIRVDTRRAMLQRRCNHVAGYTALLLLPTSTLHTQQYPATTPSRQHTTRRHTPLTLPSHAHDTVSSTHASDHESIHTCPPRHTASRRYGHMHHSGSHSHTLRLMHTSTVTATQLLTWISTHALVQAHRRASATTTTPRADRHTYTLPPLKTTAQQHSGSGTRQCHQRRSTLDGNARSAQHSRHRSLWRDVGPRRRQTRVVRRTADARRHCRPDDADRAASLSPRRDDTHDERYLRASTRSACSTGSSDALAAPVTRTVRTPATRAPPRGISCESLSQCTAAQ